MSMRDSPGRSTSSSALRRRQVGADAAGRPSGAPDAGEILLDGVDIAHLGTIDLIPIRKRMGMVFQMSALFDSMDVFDNVAFMLREHTNMTAAEIRDRVMSRLTVLSRRPRPLRRRCRRSSRAA
jgi:ABC-type Fe3+/spermidine/putrescine transport system ATPase subunit